MLLNNPSKQTLLCVFETKWLGHVISTIILPSIASIDLIPGHISGGYSIECAGRAEAEAAASSWNVHFVIIFTVHLQFATVNLIDY